MVPQQDLLVTLNLLKIFQLDSKTFFYDLNYSLTGTPFVNGQNRNLIMSMMGTGMLVHQAAHSFEKWFNVFPETNSVIKDLESMRE